MSFASREEAQDFLASNPDIEAIEAFVIDHNGIPRGKLLHREELLSIYDHGRPIPSTMLGLTVRGEDVEATGLVWEVGDMDCPAKPLAGSLVRQPWRKRPTAQVQLAMTDAAEPALHADPRAVLSRVVKRIQAAGLTPVMACELEFYLFDRDRDERGQPQLAKQYYGERPDNTQVYGLFELEQIQPFLDDLYDACSVQGIPARTAISEYAPGQVEITLQHRSDAMQAVDEAVRYKRLVKGVANKHGFMACFMAKPLGHLAGNGMHMHLSLENAAGDNIFASEQPQGTPALGQAIAGMQRYLPDSLALFCPHANSFRRFQANSYAPLAPTWGVNNRTVSFRVPGGPAASRHIEHRICGADANPYLAAAAILAAAFQGIQDQLDPGPAIVGNGYEHACDPLPTDWLTAQNAMRNSHWIHDALGAQFTKIYLAVKREEQRQFAAEVGEQDWRWYLSAI